MVVPVKKPGSQLDLFGAEVDTPGHLSGFNRSDKVADHYDSNEPFAEKLNMLVPDFVYPDWSYKTIGDLLNAVNAQHVKAIENALNGIEVYYTVAALNMPVDGGRNFDNATDAAKFFNSIEANQLPSAFRTTKIGNRSSACAVATIGKTWDKGIATHLKYASSNDAEFKRVYDCLQHSPHEITSAEFVAVATAVNLFCAEVNAPLNNHDYLLVDDYNSSIEAQYKHLNSRVVPNSVKNPAVGSWLIDSFSGIYGKRIEQVVLLPVANIEISEDTGPEKWEDVERYSQWLQEGLEPPLIRVLQSDKGRLKTLDHRRLLAAKALGKDTIAARVSFVTVDGHELTFELAQKGVRLMPIIEAREDYKIHTNDIAALERIKSNLSKSSVPVSSLESTDNLLSSKIDDALAITDAGAELVYNRRNRVKAAKSWLDVADLNDSLKTSVVIKSNIWLKPDYQALIDNGMLPLIAHMVKQVYDGVAVKPVVGARLKLDDVLMQRYISGINQIETGVLAWANDRLAVKAWISENAKLAGAMLGQSVEIKDLVGGTAKSLLETVYPGGWRKFNDEIIVCGGNKLLGSLQPGYDDIKRALKAVKNGWPSKKESWEIQGYSVCEKEKIEIIKTSSRVDSHLLCLGDRYLSTHPSLEEAQLVKENLLSFLLVDKRGRIINSYVNETEAIEAAKLLSKRSKNDTGLQVDSIGSKVEEIERVGPARRMVGEDISSDVLMTEFNLKGVNFGNWMKTPATRSEAQLHLNHAFDSLHDLADILGIPSKAIGLNGMLGLAIGAQGGGGVAAAHFIAGVNEINLTRTNGAGSLAHEWAHALDHYFAVKAGLATSAEPFLTEHAGLDLMKKSFKIIDDKRVLVEELRFPELRPEILNCFATIVEAMDKRMQTQSEADAQANARMVKAQIVVDKWLKAVRRDFVGQEVEFDALAIKIAAGDVGDGHIALSKNTYVAPVVVELRDLYKQTHGRTYSIDNIKGLQHSIDRAAYAVAEMSANSVHEPQKIATDYASAAEKLDADKGGKAYWSTRLEKFARAFDAFVSDELEARGAKNAYLSHAGRGGLTVPLGEDRVNTNAAFKTLVGEVCVQEMENSVALFSMGQKSDGPRHDVISATHDLLSAHTGLEKDALLSMLDTGLVKVVTAREAADVFGKKLFMQAWHGGNQNHDGFDSNKIGTGIGAQGFGRGHYFSNSREVGEYFRDTATTLRSDIVPVLDEFFPGRHFTTRERVVINRAANNSIPDKLAGDYIHDMKESLRDLDENILCSLVGKVREQNKGYLYEVDLKPTDDEYLDWFKPLDQQTDIIKAAFADLPCAIGNIEVGKGAYASLSANLGGRNAANDFLLAAGVRGIRYLDDSQGLDNFGNDAINYVIFDDNDIEIVGKFTGEHEVRYSNLGEALAFFNQDDGVTYFVADQIPLNFSCEEWNGLVRHEIGVHALKLGKSDVEFTDILRDFEKMRDDGDEAAVNAFDRVPKKTRPEYITEEALGYFVQNNTESSISERLAAWFKKVVRAIGDVLPVVQQSAIWKWADTLDGADLRVMAAGVLKAYNKADDCLMSDFATRSSMGKQVQKSMLKNIFEPKLKSAGIER